MATRSIRRTLVRTTKVLFVAASAVLITSQGVKACEAPSTSEHAQNQHVTEPTVTYSFYTTETGKPAPSSLAPYGLRFQDNTDFEDDHATRIPSQIGKPMPSLKLNTGVSKYLCLVTLLHDKPGIWSYTCTVPRSLAPDLSTPDGGPAQVKARTPIYS